MMQDKHNDEGQGSEVERRAFAGGADHPPEQPDQTATENEELLRSGHAAPPPGEEADTREDEPGTTLPGYG